MHKTRRILTIMLALIGLLGLTTAVASAQDPEQGQAAWGEALCQRCHGETGEGRFAGPLAGKNDLSVEEWIEQVRTGGRRMPHFSEAQISDETIQDIFAYLTSLDPVTTNNIQRPELEPDAHPGQVLIVEKRCVACHGLTGPVGNFNRRAEVPTTELVLAQLRDPRNRMPTFSEDQVSAEDAAEIAAFLAEQYAPQVQAVPSPLDKAVSALGGADALTGLQSLAMESTGMRWVLDEGFVPGGDANPVGVFTSTTSYDLVGNRLRIDITRESVGQPRQLTEIVSGSIGYLDGQNGRFGPPVSQLMSADRWAATLRQQRLLNPQLILAEVLADPSLVTDAGEVLWQGAVYHRLEMADEVAPLTLFIDVESGRIAKLATMESNPLRRDVTLEIFYYRWQPIGQAGLAFPAEIYLAYDGQIVLKEIRTAINTNPELEDALFQIPDDVLSEAPDELDPDLVRRGLANEQFLQMFAAYGFPRDGLQTEVVAEELDNGLYHLTGGSHHSLAVEQEDGIVIIEAPLDEFRSQAILNWVAETFPDKPVSYVVASHHHVDHSAGLRAFAAQGATIVVHEDAADFFRAMFEAESTVVPDAMAENPVPITIKTVPADGSLTLADDNLPVAIYAIENPHAADLVLPYVGGAVFIVDVYSPDPTAEAAGAGGELLAGAMADLGLDVSVIIGGHGGRIDVADFERILSSN